MLKYSIFALLFFMVIFNTSLRAQDTFSMIAIDSATGEFGAAGATCLINYPLGSLINRIVPGQGVVTTQSYVSTDNRDFATMLLQEGYQAQKVLDSVNKYDTSPEIRQNLIMSMDSSGKIHAVGWTGSSSNSYANHIIGPSYVIAGNILLGQHILDSMENGFLQTQGSLADKLMAALQKAKIIGADTRCNSTSSLSAYIRVARPGDGIESYFLQLDTTASVNAMFEPIDTLQKMYDNWKAVQAINPQLQPSILSFSIYPNPANESFTLAFTLRKPSTVKLEITDVQGKVITREEKFYEAGKQRMNLNGREYNMHAGVYFVKVNGSVQKLIVQ